MTVLAVAITVAIAALSYYLVERPALRLKGVTGGRRSRGPSVRRLLAPHPQQRLDLAALARGRAAEQRA